MQPRRRLVAEATARGGGLQPGHCPPPRPQTPPALRDAQHACLNPKHPCPPEPQAPLMAPCILARKRGQGRWGWVARAGGRGCGSPPGGRRADSLPPPGPLTSPLELASPGSGAHPSTAGLRSRGGLEQRRGTEEPGPTAAPPHPTPSSLQGAQRQLPKFSTKMMSQGFALNRVKFQGRATAKRSPERDTGTVVAGGGTPLSQGQVGVGLSSNTLPVPGRPLRPCVPRASLQGLSPLRQKGLSWHGECSCLLCLCNWRDPLLKLAKTHSPRPPQRGHRGMGRHGQGWGTPRGPTSQL